MVATVTDWFRVPCPTCDGDEPVDGETCPECKGDEWVFAHRDELNDPPETWETEPR